MSLAKKILIAPLDWGLGHTTRCIPIIRYLKEKKCDVIAAAEGASAALLRQNFKDLSIIELQGYRVEYSTCNAFTNAIIKQLPKIYKAIKRENNWLKNIQNRYKFDAIISDNRYGLYLNNVPSIILTHQLRIQTGRAKWADTILQKVHYKYLSRFNHCWVVDNEQNPLAPALSHPEKKLSHARYIGLLSQLENLSKENNKKSNKVLILLSGPEPQRTLFETILLRQIETVRQYQFIFVAGKPISKEKKMMQPHVEYHSHFDAAQLANALSTVNLVICRSGYSTLMDLCLTHKKALLIPTPGQTEQEYLAKHLAEKNIVVSTTQSDIVLEKDIAKVFSTSGLSGFFDVDYVSMKAAVDDLLSTIE